MATADFPPEVLIEAGERSIVELQAKIDAAHEEGIQRLMSIPYGGCWPFTKPRLRSREECEEHYGSKTRHVYSSYWWDERWFRGRINRIQEIVALARAAEPAWVRLDEGEAALIGVTGDSI